MQNDNYCHKILPLEAGERYFLYTQCHSLTPASNQAPPSQLLTPPSAAGWGRKNEENNENSNDKRIRIYVTNYRHCNCSLLTVMPSCFPSRELWPGFSPVYKLNMIFHGMECPFGLFRSVCWLQPLPASCAPPAFSLAGHEKLKSPQLSINST